jgi:predicted nucleic acid-binding protein
MHRDFMVLTDDADARRWAHRAEIPVSGTIGLLVQLVQGKVVTLAEANSLLTDMRENGYYSPVTRLDELIF